MRLLNLSKKNQQEEKSGLFSDFLLHAPEREKERVLRKAAEKANEEQRAIFRKSHSKSKAG